VRIRCAELVVALLAALLALPAAAEEAGPPAPESRSAAQAAPAEPAEPGVRVGWSKGKTVLEAPGVRIELSNRLQLRWTGDWPEGDDRTTTGSFRIRRAKTKLAGWAYDERVGFELQLNWASQIDILEDAFVDVDATGNGALRVRLGQYKVPFGRQQLTSSGSQQFVDRSITSSRFALGRDVGLMLHGAVAGGRLSYSGGIFNGSVLGGNNDDARYRIDARVQIAPNGDPGYGEADLAVNRSPRWALAAQVEHNDRGLLDTDREYTTWGGDACLKYRGLSLFGEAFFSRISPSDAESFRNDGFAVQAGYYMPGPRLEVAGRYARLKPGAGLDTSESGGALSWYREADRLKVQADLRFLDGGRLGLDDTVLRVQAQIVF